MIWNEDAILGVAVFGALKLFGYYFAVRWIARRYQPHKLAPPLVVALARVALGAIVGWLVYSTFDVSGNLYWYLMLVLARGLEWAAVFACFYERPSGAIDWDRLTMSAAHATAISCLLDLPAAFGAVIVPMMAYGFC